MHDELKDTLRQLCNRVENVLPFVPEDRAYWAGEAGYYAQKVTQYLDEIETGQASCCALDGVAPQIQAAKRMFDRIPAEAIARTPEPEPTVMHRPPEADA